MFPLGPSGRRTGSITCQISEPSFHVAWCFKGRGTAIWRLILLPQSGSSNKRDRDLHLVSSISQDLKVQSFVAFGSVVVYGSDRQDDRIPSVVISHSLYGSKSLPKRKQGPRYVISRITPIGKS
jgi:hypothetical protein